MKLYLTYDERRYGGEICAGQEDDDWPSHEDENIEWNLRECRVTRDEKNWYQEQVEIDFSTNIGSTVWVVYVRYGTGGTFGLINGAWTILGVYEHQDQAEKVKKSVYDDTYNEKYKSWQGYFEKFESCEVESMVVQGDSLWNVVRLGS
jgi:hypothetical protein